MGVFGRAMPAQTPPFSLELSNSLFSHLCCRIGARVFFDIHQ